MTTSATFDNNEEYEIKTPNRELIIVRPICELHGRTKRLEDMLGGVLGELDEGNVPFTLVEKVSEISGSMLQHRRVLFAICLSPAGINMEYYRLLEYFREHPDCLDGSIGGIIVDGASDMFTKALARRLAFSANRAGCTFPGKPLVEATGSLENFRVMSNILGKTLYETYRSQVHALVNKVLDFNPPWMQNEDEDASTGRSIAVIHASSRLTSNTLLLWDKIKQHLGEDNDITEISLRNGTMQDCRGCRYEECLHFGENNRCFYGGIMTEQVFPAIIKSDILVMLCPNYNDAVSANLTAFINRLTAIFRTHDFTHKRVYALVVSGYSGGDIVAEQIIGALNFNKAFILPPRFAILETANDPKRVLELPGIEDDVRAFAHSIK